MSIRKYYGSVWLTNKQMGISGRYLCHVFFEQKSKRKPKSVVHKNTVYSSPDVANIGQYVCGFVDRLWCVCGGGTFSKRGFFSRGYNSLPPLSAWMGDNITTTRAVSLPCVHPESIWFDHLFTRREQSGRFVQRVKSVIIFFVKPLCI